MMQSTEIKFGEPGTKITSLRLIFCPSTLSLASPTTAHGTLPFTVSILMLSLRVRWTNNSLLSPTTWCDAPLSMTNSSTEVPIVLSSEVISEFLSMCSGRSEVKAMNATGFFSVGSVWSCCFLGQFAEMWPTSPQSQHFLFSFCWDWTFRFWKFDRCLFPRSLE